MNILFGFLLALMVQSVRCRAQGIGLRVRRCPPNLLSKTIFLEVVSNLVFCFFIPRGGAGQSKEIGGKG